MPATHRSHPKRKSPTKLKLLSTLALTAALLTSGAFADPSSFVSNTEIASQQGKQQTVAPQASEAPSYFNGLSWLSAGAGDINQGMNEFTASIMKLSSVGPALAGFTSLGGVSALMGVLGIGAMTSGAAPLAILCTPAAVVCGMLSAKFGMAALEGVKSAMSNGVKSTYHTAAGFMKMGMSLPLMAGNATVWSGQKMFQGAKTMMNGIHAMAEARTNLFDDDFYDAE